MHTTVRGQNKLGSLIQKSWRLNLAENTLLHWVVFEVNIQMNSFALIKIRSSILLPLLLSSGSCFRGCTNNVTCSAALMKSVT